MSGKTGETLEVGGDHDVLARIVGFLHDSARRQAESVVDVGCGFVVMSPRYAASHDHNKLFLTKAVETDDALRRVDEMLGGAGFDHRLVVVDDDHLGTMLARGFRQAGYEHRVDLIMRYEGSAPKLPTATVTVDEATLDELCEVDRREWSTNLPDAPAHVVDQLADRRRSRYKAAASVTFLAVRNEAGHVVARADLYADPVSAVAQIEDVITDEAHRNRGLARAILAEALRRAEQAGCQIVFLLAAADDWSHRLYERLGYVTLGRRHVFRRTPGDS